MTEDRPLPVFVPAEVGQPDRPRLRPVRMIVARQMTWPRTTDPAHRLTCMYVPGSVKPWPRPPSPPPPKTKDADAVVDK